MNKDDIEKIISNPETIRKAAEESYKEQRTMMLKARLKEAYEDGFVDGFKAITENFTRVEVIDDNGRSYVNWQGGNKVELSIQDEGRTLKVFITTEKGINLSESII
jgi:hypothetical protein